MTIVTAGQLARDAQEFLRFKRAMGIIPNPVDQFPWLG
jgi:hypothetical protein